MGSVTRRDIRYCRSRHADARRAAAAAEGGDRKAEGRRAAAPFGAAGADRPVVPEGGRPRPRAAAAAARRRDRADERRHRVERRHRAQPRRAPDRARARTCWSARSTRGTPPRSRRWRSSTAFPTSSTSPRRRRSPSRATSSCSGTSRPRREIGRNGLVLLGDIFAEAKVAPKTAVFMHVNDTFGQAMAKGVAALLPKLSLPFKLRRHHPLRSGGQGPDGRGFEGEGDERGALAAGLPAERRDRPAARDGEAALEPDGRGQPRLARALRGAVRQRRWGSTRSTASRTRSGSIPRTSITQRVRGGVQEALPEGRARVSRHQRVLHLRRDPDRGRRVQAREEHRSQGARRRDPPDQHRRNRSSHFGGPIKFNAKGQVEGNRLGRDPEPARQADRRPARASRRRRSSSSRCPRYG